MPVARSLSKRAVAQGTTPLELIRETIAVHKTIRRSAKVLGVNPNTVRYWYEKMNPGRRSAVVMLHFENEAALREFQRSVKNAGGVCLLRKRSNSWTWDPDEGDSK